MELRGGQERKLIELVKRTDEALTTERQCKRSEEGTEKASIML